jgi:AraC-like DNA-binding protein
MSVSVVFVRSLIDELKRRGVEPAALLSKSRMSSEDLVDIRASVEPQQCEVLINSAVELTGDEGIGLSIGANSSENALQLFGHLLLAQRTIRDAFAVAQRYSELVAQGPSWRLIERDDVAIWGITPRLPPGRLVRVLMDYAVSVTRRIGRPLFPAGERLRAVCFQHQAPEYRERYGEVFGSPVIFGHEINGVIFARSFLDREQSHADRTVAGLLREAADQLMREREQMPQVSAQVRAFLRYHADLSAITLEKTARQLCTSTRVLRRRLLEEGATFRGLLDQARCRVACDALSQREMSILAVAESLGFSEPSAFFRAFKRWTGTTPRQFRSRASGQDEHVDQTVVRGSRTR